jgi:hypothetical protein
MVRLGAVRSFLVAVGVVMAGAATVRAQVEPPVHFGIYPQGSLYDATAPQELQSINTWIGDPARNLSLMGTFIDWEWPNPAANVPVQFNTIWNAGAVPFANVTVGDVTPSRTMAQVAQGAIDTQIRAWADVYKVWAASGTGKRAFLAPFPEMNGSWVNYGRDPVNYKLAVARIQNIFTQQGVPRNSVRWVFAPNGWSLPGDEFENYYPGNSLVDIVSFSAYNFGTCTAQGTWDTFNVAMRPYLDRMRTMAPSKPIFIAQTASTSLGGNKSLWLDDTFTQLGAYPAVRGIMYFHKFRYEGLPCDPVEWRFYLAGQFAYTGVRDAVLRPAAGFGYWAPANASWTTIAFTAGPGGNTFEDVEPAHPFAGVANVYYYNSVQRLAAVGVASGCSGSPLRFCPVAPATRDQMAVFLLRSKHGPGYVPPAAVGMFSDVPVSYWAATWIEQLVREGITGGCGGGRYCPTAPVTRAQMAPFLLVAKHGSGYVPPPATGMFTDVPTTYWAAAWIEQLAREGITGGCGGGGYCPESSVIRGQMAVFLVATFGL